MRDERVHLVYRRSAHGAEWRMVETSSKAAAAEGVATRRGDWSVEQAVSACERDEQRDERKWRVGE